MKLFLIATFCMCASVASAQSSSEVDDAYKVCRGHYTNHPRTDLNGKNVTVLGYEPGWEKCGDIEQAYYNEAQKNLKSSDADKKQVHDLATKLFPSTKPPKGNVK